MGNTKIWISQKWKEFILRHFPQYFKGFPSVKYEKNIKLSEIPNFDQDGISEGDLIGVFCYVFIGFLLFTELNLCTDEIVKQHF